MSKKIYSGKVELTPDEWEILKSQFVISSWGGTRKLPFAFTEQGLAMLSGVLNSDIAIEVNIKIMRAFVAVRQMLAAPPVDRVGLLESQMNELRGYMEEVFADYNDINDDARMQLELINQTLAELQAQKACWISHATRSALNRQRKTNNHTSN